MYYTGFRDIAYLPRRHVVARAAHRAFLEQLDTPLFQPREQIAPDVGVQPYALLQVLVLVHETDLGGSRECRSRQSREV